MTPQDEADIDELVDALTSYTRKYTKPQMVKRPKTSKRELARQARWGSKRNWGHQRRG